MVDVSQSIESLIPQVAFASDLPQEVLDYLSSFFMVKVVQSAEGGQRVSPFTLGRTVFYHEVPHGLEQVGNGPVAPDAGAEDRAGRSQEAGDMIAPSAELG